MVGDFFIVVLSILIVLFIGYLIVVHRTDDKKKNTIRAGVVKNLRQVYKGLGFTSVTIFEIHGPDETIFYAGFGGHNNEFKHGDTIEFEPSDEIIANEIFSTDPLTDKDGFKTIKESRRYYYALERYRVTSA